MRDHPAAWVELAGLDKHATALRALAPIMDPASARASTEVMHAARAAWDAEGFALWEAAKNANWRAHRDEKWDAAVITMIRAAWYTARDAVHDATWHVKGRDSDAAYWDAARDGDWVAMPRRISPTVKALQASTVELVERMIAV